MKTKPKIHGPILRAIEESLVDIFQNGYYADKTVERRMKHERKWGARDRRQYAEAVYDIVRWWRLLNHMTKSEDPSRNVNTYFNDFKEFGEKFGEFQKSIPNRAVRESVPDWLDALGESELGERWGAILSASNRQAASFLRVNSLRATREVVQARLLDEGVKTEPLPDAPWGLKLVERANVFRTKAYLAGMFEMQDGASQQIAPLLDPKPGERVLDACAGAGGKSLHLAAMMQNKGRIIAMDIHEWKLKELRKRAARGGVDIVEVKVVEGQKTVKRLADGFDRVLIDAPCSGLGVLRRKPDTKWKLTAEAFASTKLLQKELLDQYSRSVKVGGVVVYATCSVMPSENHLQVAEFLSRQAGTYRLEREISFFPDDSEYDGFYAARLKRER